MLVFIMESLLSGSCWECKSISGVEKSVGSSTVGKQNPVLSIQLPQKDSLHESRALWMSMDRWDSQLYHAPRR